MIRKREIELAAEQNGVAKSTIDKDWVLVHFIDAIFSIDEFARLLTGRPRGSRTPAAVQRITAAAARAD